MNAPATVDMAFYLAGADPFEGDQLGGLSVTKDGLRLRDEMILNHCHSRSIPVTIAMAGGYAADVNDIVDIQFETLCAATRRFGIGDHNYSVHTPGKQQHG